MVLRIAFVVFDDIPDGGAVAHRVQMLAAGLASLGHEVHIIAPYRFSPGPLNGEIDRVHLHWGAYIERKTANTTLARVRKRLLMYNSTRQLLSQGLDWLIIYDMGLEGLPFLFLAKSLGCKVAADNCDITYISEQKSLLGLFYVISDRLGNILVTPWLQLNFAISSRIEEDLRHRAPLVPQVRVLAPVDMGKFKRRPQAAQSFRERHGLQDVPVIGYFGSIWAGKGLQVLLQAAHQLLAYGKPFKLLITGNAARNAYFLQLINELGLKDQVILTGFLSTDELITAMSVPDILVEPKIEDQENQASFPQKLAEYLAMGKPIVASAIGDIPLFLHDQENALLCQPGNPGSLAAALLRLMQDDHLKERLSKNARETAGRYFDCQVIARRIERALITHI
jgi:glycosyltransferase involved in cell wall biosynthesis